MEFAGGNFSEKSFNMGENLAISVCFKKSLGYPRDCVQDMPPILLMKFAIRCTLLLLLELLLSVCLRFSFSSIRLRNRKSYYLTQKNVFIGYLIAKSLLKINLNIHFGYRIEAKRRGKKIAE